MISPVREDNADLMSFRSPPRARRPSEFLKSTSLDRPPGRALFGPGHVPPLSTSASLISPLNPLPSPWSVTSDGQSMLSPVGSTISESSTHSTTPSSGAIRLNRVPTSVRLAAELMKNPNSTLSPPSTDQSDSFPGSAIPTTSIPTPNPSPVGSLPMPTPLTSLKELGDFKASVARAPIPIPMEIGKGRPSLTVPGTPLAPRNMSMDKGGISPTNISGGNPDPAKLPAMATLAPPSAFKAPLPPSLPRQRPVGSQDSGSDAVQPPRTHRYRTSMHEASMRSGLSSSFAGSPPSWAVDPQAAGPSKSPPYGLGLNVPPATARPSVPSASGSLTPGAHPGHLPRMRSTTGKALQMDLAGIPALGDAASHASMIMQSRQAKLQRWRPNSAGNQVSFRCDGLILADRNRFNKVIDRPLSHPHSIARLQPVHRRCLPVRDRSDKLNGKCPSPFQPLRRQLQARIYRPFQLPFKVSAA